MAGTDKKTSIEKALDLLALFTNEPYEYTIPQIVKLTGMNRTTVYRNINVLEDFGLLMKDEYDKCYKIGPMAYRMGSIYLNNANYEGNLLAILERIAEESKESVGLARREGNSVVSIYSVEIHQPVKMNDKPGTFYPMNRGTYGKCLMAYHDQKTVGELLRESAFEKMTPNTITDPDELLQEYAKIRKQGFVTSIDESFAYITGVGIPICSHDGKVRNVVAISFFRQDDYLEKIERMKELLFKYKSDIEQYIL